MGPNDLAGADGHVGIAKVRLVQQFVTGCGQTGDMQVAFFGEDETLLVVRHEKGREPLVLGHGFACKRE